jgi:hypothetical protein
MRQSIFLFSAILLSLNCSAHSGRTDSSGGHNCSQKSIEKGLCTGYHYHNGKFVAIDDTQLDATVSSEVKANPDSDPSHINLNTNSIRDQAVIRNT